MTTTKTILITGASGNLGHKLSQHLADRYSLRLLDINPRRPGVIQADFSQWDEQWVTQFAGVDTVVHLAANPGAAAPWADLVGPNIDALINVFTAAAQQDVKRVVYASSNHVMGAYKDIPTPEKLGADTAVNPGTHFVANGEMRNSIAYGGAKLFGERLGKCYADSHGISTIAVRIGWVQAGENHTADIPAAREDWFRQMWLSNRDFCQVIERAIEADVAIKFAIINGMSDNPGMRWNIEEARELIGYVPEDKVIG